MADYPMVRTMKRGGKYRTCIFVQPHIDRGGCYDIARCIWMSL